MKLDILFRYFYGKDVEEVDLAPNWIEDIFKCSNFSKDTFLIIWSYAGISETQFWEFDIEDIPKVCSERALFYLIYATPGKKTSHLNFSATKRKNSFDNRQ